MLNRWKAQARTLKLRVSALSFAILDPRTPWYLKVFAVIIVAYALSPIDLIPDFIPVLGLLDDLILLPLGIALIIRLIPREVLAAAEAHAESGQHPLPWSGRVTAFVIVLIWVASFTAITFMALRWLGWWS